MLSRYAPIALFLILLTACGGKGAQDRWTRKPKHLPSYAEDPEDDPRVLFYNCENLFDTLDAEGKDDDAFTPEGAYGWDSERYKEKLERIAEVVGSFASGPELVGLCEVENEGVIEELLRTSPLKSSNYGYIHHESRDPRGIDLALLYDPTHFHPYDRKAHQVSNPATGTPSRPILSIGLESRSRDSLRLFLCHWPSRAGGKAESEPDRMNASDILQGALKELHRDHPSRKVLIMGDLNDHPPNKSVQALLKGDHGYRLKDLLAEAHRSGIGTYNYRGEWGVLDHFIVNRELRKASSGLRYRSGTAHILRTKEMLYYDEEGGHHQPDRYMEHGEYYGGYSDHLPIHLKLEESQAPKP